MPNIKSQKDRVVQAAAEQAHNKAIKTNLKTVESAIWTPGRCLRCGISVW